MSDEPSYTWSVGPITFLRVGLVWSLDIGRVGIFGVIGAGFGFRRIDRTLKAVEPAPLPTIPPEPPLTDKMKREGFIWVYARCYDGVERYIEVCKVCGGNCGQCGTSLGLGVPPQMDKLTEGLDK